MQRPSYPIKLSQVTFLIFKITLRKVTTGNALQISTCKHFLCKQFTGIYLLLNPTWQDAIPPKMYGQNCHITGAIFVSMGWLFSGRKVLLEYRECYLLGRPAPVLWVPASLEPINTLVPGSVLITPVLILRVTRILCVRVRKFYRYSTGEDSLHWVVWFLFLKSFLLC